MQGMWKEEGTAHSVFMVYITKSKFTWDFLIQAAISFLHSF